LNEQQQLLLVTQQLLDEEQQLLHVVQLTLNLTQPVLAKINRLKKK
jgi:hypothetical protein